MFRSLCSRDGALCGGRLAMMSRRSSPYARDATKLTHQVAIELRTHVEQDFIGSCARERGLVGSALDQGTENIRNRKDANEVGNLTTFETMRVSGPVEILVMMKNGVDHFLGNV